MYDNYIITYNNKVDNFPSSNCPDKKRTYLLIPAQPREKGNRLAWKTQSQ